MEQQYGGFWRRVLATIIDSIVISIVQWVIAIPLGINMTSESFDMNATILNFVLAALYYTLLHASAWQATIGKKVLKMKVVTADGAKLSYGRAFWRYIAYIISALPLGIGFLLAAFTSQKRALHDFLAGTYVIKE